MNSDPSSMLGKSLAVFVGSNWPGGGAMCSQCHRQRVVNGSVCQSASSSGTLQPSECAAYVKRKGRRIFVLVKSARFIRQQSLHSIDQDSANFAHCTALRYCSHFSMEIGKLYTYFVLALRCPWPVTWAVMARMNGTPIHFPDRTEWRLRGKLHRIGGPAVERADGSKVWHEHGKLHRIGGPAVELADGTNVWWEHGGLHRIGEPAVECVNGTKEWYEHGKLHRIGGPAVEWTSGSKVWFEHGERHRVGGPAIEWADGREEWYEHGKPHRIGGPAIERADGSKEWWERGHQIKQRQ